MRAAARKPTFAQPLAAAAGAILAIGAASSPSPGPAVDPGAATPAVILRMEEVGGLAPLQTSLFGLPAFTLYADGQSIFQASGSGATDGPAAPLRRAILDHERSSALIARALDEGGLRDARAEYAADRVADATTTVFTVQVEGVHRTVSIHGLGFGEDGPDREALARFRALAEHLADPAAWLPDDVEVTPYEPERYRGVFTEDDPEGPGLLPWPWDDLTPTDLEPLEDATAISMANLTPEQVALVAEVPNGGASDIAIASPDGRSAWRLALRPLLPDEGALLDTVPVATPSPTSRPRPADDGQDDG